MRTTAIWWLFSNVKWRRYRTLGKYETVTKTGVRGAKYSCTKTICQMLWSLNCKLLIKWNLLNLLNVEIQQMQDSTISSCWKSQGHDCINYLPICCYWLIDFCVTFQKIFKKGDRHLDITIIYDEEKNNLYISFCWQTYSTGNDFCFHFSHPRTSAMKLLNQSWWFIRGTYSCYEPPTNGPLGIWDGNLFLYMSAFETIIHVLSIYG